MHLRHLLDAGEPVRAIAQRLGCSPRTIQRWRAAGELERDLDAPVRYRPRPPVPTKLAPYQPLIAARLAAYPALSAVRLLAECRAAGYPGGYSQLKAYVAQVRPRSAPAPVVRFETPPGHQAQVDFATVRLPWGTRYALLVVLGYSRLLFVQFVERQDMPTLFRGLEAAFAYFGGVPRELLFDQMRAVVTADARLSGGRLVENAEALRFAAHWGFRLRACRPYRAQTKGKVERPVRYLRDGFVYGRDFIGDADLAAQLTDWLARVANVRVHATLKESPLVRFERDERAVLGPLAPRPYRSLLLAPPPAVPAPPRLARPRGALPRITVERRPLATYAALAGGGR